MSDDLNFKIFTGKHAQEPPSVFPLGGWSNIKQVSSMEFILYPEFFNKPYFCDHNIVSLIVENWS